MDGSKSIEGKPAVSLCHGQGPQTEEFTSKASNDVRGLPSPALLGAVLEAVAREAKQDAENISDCKSRRKLSPFIADMS